MSTKRLLLVASTTGYQTRMFLDAAQALGYEAILATDRCHVLEDPWGDQALPLRFEDPEGSAESVASQLQLDGVVALGDRPAYVAAVIAKRLGLRFHPVEAVAACRDKYAARSKFQAAGLLVPQFDRVALDSPWGRHSCLPGLPTGTGQAGKNACPTGSHAPYPCVLKPLGLSASRGVIRANNTAEFATAFERIRALLDSPDIRRLGERQDRFIQVESFIPGREFALEGIVTEGHLTALALFDKPDPLDGPFFEETIYVTPSVSAPAIQEAIYQTTQAAVLALGLTNGPIHAEMRVNSEGVWMLEVAARPIGGLCARVLPGLPELILRHACGEAWSTQSVKGAAAVMMIPIPRAGIYQGVTGVEAALEVPGIEDVIVTAKQGERLVPLPEGNSYVGFLFARGNNPGDVEAALRTAHARLSFEITSALHVIL